MGILDWIEEKARKKMRFSHVKILYQNKFAAEFLVRQLEGVTEVPAGAETIGNLREIQVRTQAFMDEMPEDDMLKDASSTVVFADNGALKKTYAAVNAAPELAGPAKAVDFAERFKPAAGWKAFSDADWAEVVSGQGAA